MKYTEYYLRLLGFLLILIGGWGLITPVVYVFLGWFCAIIISFLVLLSAVWIVNPVLDYLNDK